MEERRKSATDEWLKRVLALSAVWGFMLAAGVVLTGLSTGAIKDPVVGIVCGSVLATLASEYKGVMGYIFGSSAGSEAKTATLNRALAAAEPQTTSTITSVKPAPDGQTVVETTTAPADPGKKEPPV